jgi:ketosteroid isomerase-like protein
MLDDMLSTIGSVFLGTTIGCARCHDHKFDPLTQREYYEFTAFFNQTPVNGGGGDPATPPIIETGSPELRGDIVEADKIATLRQAQVEARQKAIATKQSEWEAKRREALAKLKTDDWVLMTPIEAKAKGQRLTIEPSGAVLASGENPEKDEYELVYRLAKGGVTAFKLEAVRHPDRAASADAVRNPDRRACPSSQARPRRSSRHCRCTAMPVAR